MFQVRDEYDNVIAAVAVAIATGFIAMAVFAFFSAFSGCSPREVWTYTLESVPMDGGADVAAE